MSEIIPKILPVILLTLIGVATKKYNIIEVKTIAGIKKIILNICLPSTLFLIFLNMKLEKEHILLILAMMFLFVLFYLVGAFINKVSRVKNDLKQFFCTGFCFGLLGIPLFIIVFGVENLGIYSILGLSHEMFVWFIYYPVLAIKLDGSQGMKKSVNGILRSPLNISIILGVSANLLNLNTLFYNNEVGLGFVNTIKYLGDLNAPLILICLGHGMNFNRSYMKESLRLVFTRVFVTFIVGYGFKALVLDRLVTSNKEVFAYSFFTLIVLPPLFSLPLFLSKYDVKKEEQLINNATVQNTILSMVLFVGYSIFKSF